MSRVVCSIHLGGRDIVTLQEFLCEDLAAFELRGLLRRSDDRPASVGEGIADSVHERQFGADNRQVRPELIGESNELGHIS